MHKRRELRCKPSALDFVFRVKGLGVLDVGFRGWGFWIHKYEGLGIWDLYGFKGFGFRVLGLGVFWIYKGLGILDL